MNITDPAHPLAILAEMLFRIKTEQLISVADTVLVLFQRVIVYAVICSSFLCS